MPARRSQVLPEDRTEGGYVVSSEHSPSVLPLTPASPRQRHRVSHRGAEGRFPAPLPPSIRWLEIPYLRGAPDRQVCSGIGAHRWPCRCLASAPPVPTAPLGSPKGSLPSARPLPALCPPHTRT